MTTAAPEPIRTISPSTPRDDFAETLRGWYDPDSSDFDGEPDAPRERFQDRRDTQADDEAPWVDWN